VLYPDGQGHCFSCNYHKFKDEKEDFILSDFSYEFTAHRGISKDTFARYNVKTKIDGEGKPVADGFVYPNGAVKVRYLDQKEFYWEKNGKEASKAGLFGMDKFQAGSHKYVTITEGEYDALSLHQVIGGPVVSVQSAVTAHRDVISALPWLSSFERVYLAFDGDGPGQVAAAAVAKLFDYNKVYFVKLTKRKDANDFLQYGEEDELKQAWWNAKTYRPDNISSTLSEFKTVLDNRRTKGMMLYPTATLNDMTYGIRTSETVLITAMEGVGKTELMHAIEYKALTETDHAVGAIYLEETQGDHLRALAGIHLKRPVHLPDCGVSDAEIYTAVEQVVGTDDRLHLYSHFGSDDPRILEDTIRFLVAARGCRIILLDHITMAVAGLADEKDQTRALDYLSTRLDMLSVELDFALILASHINDDYKTRGSRLISKNCHVHVQLRRDLENPDPYERSVTHITMPKNRPISRTGPAGKAIFDVDTRRYKEVDNVEFTRENTDQREAA
jgi:twinkle protein